MRSLSILIIALIVAVVCAGCINAQSMKQNIPKPDGNCVTFNSTENNSPLVTSCNNASFYPDYWVWYPIYVSSFISNNNEEEYYGTTPMIRNNQNALEPPVENEIASEESGVVEDISPIENVGEEGATDVAASDSAADVASDGGAVGD